MDRIYCFLEQLFCGDSTEKYFVLKEYIVLVDFPTITDEAYMYIKSSVKIGMSLNIQLASWIIGKAKMIDFVYINDDEEIHIN